MTTDRDPRDEIVEHLSALRAFALSLTGRPDAADDLVQDCIERAWRAFGSYRPGTNMRAWLFTILRNSFYSSRRRLSREVQDSDGILTATLAQRPAHDGRLALNDFHAAFQRLPVEQREALMLVGASGFSYDEAAAMCGVPSGTMKSRANRARRRLAELLQLEDGEGPTISDMTVVAAMPDGGGLS